MNSRPLTSLLSDPNDYQPLTPAHFLIGRAITSIPEADVREVKVNRLQNYQRILQIKQHFWERWSKEYVTNLQYRTKWKTNIPNCHKDQLVIIKEENLPPLKWKLGRIVDMHPGPDGIIRVITIKTSAGTIKRPVLKVCVLPLPSEDIDPKVSVSRS